LRDSATIPNVSARAIFKLASATLSGERYSPPEDCMNPRTIVTIGIGAGMLAASAWLLAQSGGALSAGRARELLRRVGGGERDKDQVRIKSVTPGIGGSDAIVEAQIETAFRFTREGGQWRVAEIRLGDRQWESFELITEAVRREKLRRTAALLRQLGEALEAYRRERGNYVVADEMAVLADHLAPRYLGAPLRFDLWGAEFRYRGTANGYQLVSSGPDRQPGTADDLVLENGTLRPSVE
jgi:hypothetical protein